MDTQVEDKMYRQIEKSLSSQMNDNLFQSGIGMMDGKHVAIPDKEQEQDESEHSYKASGDYNQPLPISRAEYIRQAREACLKQLNASQISSEVLHSIIIPEQAEEKEELPNKKMSSDILLNKDDKEEANPTEEARAFQFLIVRTICAIVLFLTIFLFDKLDIKWGEFSPSSIKKYVIEDNKMEELETMIVSWIK